MVLLYPFWIQEACLPLLYDKEQPGHLLLCSMEESHTCWNNIRVFWGELSCEMEVCLIVLNALL